MNCAPFDLRDYYFEALGGDERRQVREHLDRCERCGAELERLRLTAVTLSALPEEEIPRRIAFVSDKVFEPSPVVRWWQSFWLSGARLGSAAAFALAFAIFFHAYHSSGAPAPNVKVVEKIVGPAATDPALIQTAVDRAVANAVAAVESRYDAKLTRVIAENNKQRREIIRATEFFDAMDRQNKVNLVASNRLLESGQ